MDNKNDTSLQQKHIAAALKYVKQGGTDKEASDLLNQSREDQVAFLKMPGHPLNTFYAENTAINDLIENKLLPDLKKWQQDGKNKDLLTRLQKELKQLSTIKYHYKRKENSLFSFLVKYHLASEATSSALWSLDDKVYDLIVDAIKAVNNKPLPDKYVIEAKIEKATNGVERMLFLEETLICPMLALIMSPADWYMVKQDELEIGFTLITAPQSWMPTREELDQGKVKQDQFTLNSQLKKDYIAFLKTYLLKDKEMLAYANEAKALRGDPSYPVGDSNNGPALVFKHMENMTVKMEIGSLSLKEIPAIFNVLPIDLTFVDKDDRVKWFSNTDRVFPRTRSVIGRPVIRCHPPKSINKVLSILKEFHDGISDSEEFWVNVHGHTIYLCFYAVRDNEDNYLGCLETVQDITKFKAIDGEQTLENKK